MKIQFIQQKQANICDVMNYYFGDERRGSNWGVSLMEASVVLVTI